MTRGAGNARADRSCLLTIALRLVAEVDGSTRHEHALLVGLGNDSREVCLALCSVAFM
jgi:hypothetical protein